MANVPRSPIIIPRPFVKWVQPLIVTNLLVTTLAVTTPSVPVQAGQLSFPEQIYRVKNLTAAQAIVQPAKFDLTTLSQYPFVATLTSLQVLPKTVGVAHLPAQPPRFDLNTLSQNPFIQSSTVPSPPRRIVQDPQITPALNLTTLFTVVVPPFAQTDWTNPVQSTVHPWVQQPQVTPSLNLTTLFTIVIPPFAQNDWPNPLPKRIPQIVDYPAPFDRTIPFNLDDWPNPKTRILPREWGSIAPLEYSEFIIVPTMPYGLLDWPNPALRITPHEWGEQSSIEYDEFVNTPLPVPTPEPTIILVGGDDAPKKRKRQKTFQDLAHDIEQTIQQLVHPSPVEDVRDAIPIPISPGEAGRALDELVVLAKGQQSLLQRVAALRAELKQAESVRQAMLEQDEEDALIWMF